MLVRVWIVRRCSARRGITPTGTSRRRPRRRGGRSSFAFARAWCILARSRHGSRFAPTMIGHRGGGAGRVRRRVYRHSAWSECRRSGFRSDFAELTRRTDPRLGWWWTVRSARDSTRRRGGTAGARRRAARTSIGPPAHHSLHPQPQLLFVVAVVVLGASSVPLRLRVESRCAPRCAGRRHRHQERRA